MSLWALTTLRGRFGTPNGIVQGRIGDPSSFDLRKQEARNTRADRDPTGKRRPKDQSRVTILNPARLGPEGDEGKRRKDQRLAGTP